MGVVTDGCGRTATGGAQKRPRRVRGGAMSWPGAAGRRREVARPLLNPSPTAMDDKNFEVITAAQARRALTKGDIKCDVAFQNDINRLLASLDDLFDVRDIAPRLRAAQG